MPRLIPHKIPNKTELTLSLYKAFVESRPLDVCKYCQDLLDCRETVKAEHPGYVDTPTKCIICGQVLDATDN